MANVFGQLMLFFFKHEDFNTAAQQQDFSSLPSGKGIFPLRIKKGTYKDLRCRAFLIRKASSYKKKDFSSCALFSNLFYKRAQGILSPL